MNTRAPLVAIALLLTSCTGASVGDAPATGSVTYADTPGDAADEAAVDAADEAAVDAADEAAVDAADEAAVDAADSTASNDFADAVADGAESSVDAGSESSVDAMEGADAGPGAQPLQGVYRGAGPNGVANIRTYDAWLGKQVPLAIDYEAQDWKDIANPAWWLKAWGQWVSPDAGTGGQNLAFAVPMLPAANTLDGGTVSLAACASGAYDATWTTLAQKLVYYGLPNAYLRLGWEFDGNWYPWGAPRGSGLAPAYAGCFRDIVVAMRAAAPTAHFSFAWNTATNFANDPAYLASAWPGADVVDYVAIDIYDASWAPGTYPYPSPCDATCVAQRQQAAWNVNSAYFATLASFAASQGKPMAVPEWGLCTGTHGGGDDPYFVQQMYGLLTNPANNVAWQAYFDGAGHGLSIQPYTYPNSSALFLRLF